MTSKVFNPMNDIRANESKIVKLISLGTAKQGQYGLYYPDCMIEIDGAMENWQIPQSKVDALKQAGFSEGFTFKIERWYRDGKGGYNFKSPDSKNPYAQPTETHQKTPQIKSEPDWDAIAEGKVRHGVAVAYIEAGKPLNDLTKEEIAKWTSFIINGK